MAGTLAGVLPTSSRRPAGWLTQAVDLGHAGRPRRHSGSPFRGGPDNALVVRAGTFTTAKDAKLGRLIVTADRVPLRGECPAPRAGARLKPGHHAAVALNQRPHGLGTEVHKDISMTPEQDISIEL